MRIDHPHGIIIYDGDLTMDVTPNTGEPFTVKWDSYSKLEAERTYKRLSGEPIKTRGESKRRCPIKYPMAYLRKTKENLEANFDDDDYLWYG